MEICQECGMQVEKSSEYHPYAACLMFKGCHNREVVQANLDAVVAHGAWLQQESEKDTLPLGEKVPTIAELRDILTPNAEVT